MEEKEAETRLRQLERGSSQKKKKKKKTHGEDSLSIWIKSFYLLITQSSLRDLIYL